MVRLIIPPGSTSSSVGLDARAALRANWRAQTPRRRFLLGRVTGEHVECDILDDRAVACAHGGMFPCFLGGRMPAYRAGHVALEPIAAGFRAGESRDPRSGRDEVGEGVGVFVDGSREGVSGSSAASSLR